MYILKTEQFELKTDNKAFLQGFIMKMNISSIRVENEIKNDPFVKSMVYCFLCFTDEDGKKYELKRGEKKQIGYDISNLPVLLKDSSESSSLDTIQANNKPNEPKKAKTNTRGRKKKNN